MLQVEVWEKWTCADDIYTFAHYTFSTSFLCFTFWQNKPLKRNHQSSHETTTRKWFIFFLRLWTLINHSWICQILCFKRHLTNFGFLSWLFRKQWKSLTFEAKINSNPRIGVPSKPGFVTGFAYFFFRKSLVKTEAFCRMVDLGSKQYHKCRDLSARKQRWQQHCCHFLCAIMASNKRRRVALKHSSDNTIESSSSGE